MVGQIIRTTLGNAMPWLLALLLGAAVYKHMQAERYASERDAEQQRAEAAEARNEALGQALEWQRDRIQVISQALTQRDERLASIAQSMADKRQSLDTLERSDAETRNWAEQPLPDGVVSWVRQLGTEADSGAADVHSTATPDQADSGSKAERE